MTSISSLGGTSAWPSTSQAGGMRPPRHGDPTEMFKKVDADSSGGVDATELQDMLGKMPGASEGTPTSASDFISQYDSDGDGSLNQSELGTGMQSLMPSRSTQDFAAQRSGGQDEGAGGVGGMGGPPPGPPPSEGAGGASSSSSTGYDPLDTNQDGTVSAEEAAAGEAAKQLLQELTQAVDTDQDGRLSRSEMDTFKQVLTEQYSSMTSVSSSSGSTSSGDSSGSSSASGSSSQADPMAQLTELAKRVIQRYADMAASTTSASTSSTLSVAA